MPNMEAPDHYRQPHYSGSCDARVTASSTKPQNMRCINLPSSTVADVRPAQPQVVLKPVSKRPELMLDLPMSSFQTDLQSFSSKPHTAGEKLLYSNQQFQEHEMLPPHSPVTSSESNFTSTTTSTQIDSDEFIIRPSRAKPPVLPRGGFHARTWKILPGVRVGRKSSRVQSLARHNARLARRLSELQRQVSTIVSRLRTQSSADVSESGNDVEQHSYAETTSTDVDKTRVSSSVQSVQSASSSRTAFTRRHGKETRTRSTSSQTIRERLAHVKTGETVRVIVRKRPLVNAALRPPAKRRA